MILKSAYGIAALTLALSGPALADPATPEEARRLTALLERYVGHAADGPSAVTVTPLGEGYKAELDVGRLLAPLREAGLNVTKSGTFAMMLTPQSDGTWHVTAGDIPPLSVNQDNQVFSVAILGHKLDGVFDPKIGTFKSATSSMSGTTVHSDGPKGTSDVQSRSETSSTGTAEDAGNGSANSTSSLVVKDPAYSFNVTLPGEGPGAKANSVTADARASQFSAEFNGKNQRIGGLLDLWAFLVAHPSKEALAENESELKTRLKAVIPFASEMSGELKASNVVVNTPEGQFGAAELFEHYDVKDNALTTLRMSGFSMPAGVVPAWAIGLVPTGFEYTQSYGPIAVTAALMSAVDDLDLSADEPLTEEQSGEIAKSLTPADNTLLSVPPSSITTPLVTVKFQGEMRISKPMPTGTATVSVSGLDKAIDQIRATAPQDPQAAQAIQFLSAVKILAKAEGADAYSWRIEALPGQDITVNGNSLAAAAPKPSARKKKTEP